MQHNSSRVDEKYDQSIKSDNLSYIVMDCEGKTYIYKVNTPLGVNDILAWNKYADMKKESQLISFIPKGSGRLNSLPVVIETLLLVFEPSGSGSIPVTSCCPVLLGWSWTSIPLIGCNCCSAGSLTSSSEPTTGCLYTRKDRQVSAAKKSVKLLYIQWVHFVWIMHAH